VRVIAGEAGGMRIKAPSGITTRPTTDRVKEALFSILQSANKIKECRILDLFAGSGSLGIEALSRGAEFAFFVEKASSALDALKYNLTHTRYMTKSEILTIDINKALELLYKKKELFDLILLDPPYNSDYYLYVIEFAGSKLLKPDGFLVAETSVKNLLPEKIGVSTHFDRRVYGDTALEFFNLEQSYAP
jgi:16S rRNA (guanine(966)-N(2))-methyltransferase RsmD